MKAKLHMVFLLITRLLSLSTLVTLSSNVYAHIVPTNTANFYEGITHPLSGYDHLLVILSLGLWASQKNKFMRIVLVLTFVSFMLFGGLGGVCGIYIPFVETGIAISIVVLGMVLIIPNLKINEFLACTVIAIFAILHGHAHGTGLIHSAAWISYFFGFIISSILIYLTGLSLGIFLNRIIIKTQILKAIGLAITSIGIGCSLVKLAM